ncbi:hypothetical protein [Emticicia sp.]|uniref:hypothetical protein n=1 Tax=Emticicia sp. TaxID=1930953 RepID=UPI0037522992
MTNIYYSSSQETLIMYQDGKLIRVSKKDKLYSEQESKETAILRWIDDSFEQKDQQFADEFIEVFSTAIKPKRNMIGWLFCQNPDYFHLSEAFKAEFDKRMIDKYGKEALTSPTQPLNENIIWDFNEMVQWYSDRISYPESLQAA